MSSSSLRVHPFRTALYAAAILFLPAALATPAVQDFTDLRTLIQNAASSIGADNNPNKGWGSGGNGQPGTADLVNNITETILRSKWQLDTNRTSWLSPNGFSAPSDSSNTTTWLPTAPITSSIILPTAMPTATTVETTVATNLTVDLSQSYTDYISSIPNLSSSLISLGRTYHTEMNAPVYQAIAALLQSVSALQTSLLQNNLIDGAAVVRTVRASNSMADAQQAWTQYLNLPGVVSVSVGSRKRARRVTTGSFQDPEIRKIRAASTRPPPADGKYYTHQELWGRNGLTSRPSMEQKAKRQDWGDKSDCPPNKTAEKMRMRRVFTT